MSRVAKVTLGVSAFFCVATIWGVHYLQIKEREVMYQGVLKDEARMEAKKRQREEDLQASVKKRELYERFQTVEKTTPSEA
ncbi:hypothetical protein FRB99_004897 [Tulasnella sp. 403]|nr:hypothetical protein FRB99_004897 [Tulasnella sp. 403]